MIYCMKLEIRCKARNAKDLRICSSKEENMMMVSNIFGLEKTSIVYLVVFNDLLEDNTSLEGCNGFLTLYKRTIRVC